MSTNSSISTLLLDVDSFAVVSVNNNDKENVFSGSDSMVFLKWENQSMVMREARLMRLLYNCELHNQTLIEENNKLHKDLDEKHKEIQSLKRKLTEETKVTWTPVKDNILISLVDEHEENWELIAEKLDFDEEQCSRRFHLLKANQSVWTKELDIKLKEATQFFGLKWREVAAYCGANVTKASCKKRWEELHANSGELSEEETSKLLELIKDRRVFGTTWLSIATTMGKPVDYIEFKAKQLENKPYSIPINQFLSDTKFRWNSERNQKLLDTYELYPENWEAIANECNFGITLASFKKRWHYLTAKLNNDESNQLKELLKERAETGKSWESIAKKMNRSATFVSARAKLLQKSINDSEEVVL